MFNFDKNMEEQHMARNKDGVTSFEVHKAEAGGYVIREPWANGRLWVVGTVDDLIKWVKDNLIQ